MKDLKKIKIWYSILNAGDGSSYLEWFLTKESAYASNEEELAEGWGYGSVETFVGSNIYQEAMENRTSHDNEIVFLENC